MFIEKVTIKDFKNVPHFEGAFSQINLISGRPGKGKSGIIEAITLLLVNELPDKIDEYVRRGGPTKFIISMVFTHHGHTYDYTIEGTKKTSTTKRRLVIDSNETDIYEGSEAVLKMSEIIAPDLTLYSNISRQHDSTSLLSEKPAPRLQKLKKILKVDDVDKAVNLMIIDRDEIKDNIKSKKLEISLLEGKSFRYEDLPTDPEIDIISLRKELEKLIEVKTVYESELEEYQKYKIQLDLYNKSNYSNERFLTEFNLNKAMIKSLEKDLIVVPDYDNEEYYNLVKIQNDLRGKLKDLNTQDEMFNAYIDKQSKLSELVSEATKTIEDLGKPRRLVEPKVVDFTDIDAEINEYKAKLITKTKHLELAKAGKCPTCEQVFESHSEDIEKDILDLNMNIDALKVKRGEIVDTITNYRIEKETNDSLKHNISTQKAILDIHTKSLKDLGKEEVVSLDYKEILDAELELEDIDTKIKEALQAKRQADDADVKNKKINADIASFKNTNLGLKLSIDNFEQTTEPEKFSYSVKYSAEYFDSVQKDIRSYEDYEKAYSQIAEFNKKTKVVEDDNIVSISKLNDYILEQQRELSILDETIKVVGKDFSAYLIEKGTSHIRNKMNEFFQRSYGKYSVEFRQNKRGVEYYYRGDEEDTLCSVNTLSGFEKQVFGTAQRIAFTTLQDLDFFIADEIDSDAPSEDSLELYKALLNENFGQYFIITHNSDTKEYIENIGCTLYEV